MISVLSKKNFSNMELIMTYDSVCECYTVSVVYFYTRRNFFTRDYKIKRFATRCYNSWVTKLSAVDAKFSKVR